MNDIKRGSKESNDLKRGPKIPHVMEACRHEIHSAFTRYPFHAFKPLKNEARGQGKKDSCNITIKDRCCIHERWMTKDAQFDKDVCH